MQPNSSISTLEKFISIVSYFTMGLFGLFWLILAYSVKKKLRYFLQYNIVQSLLISILLAIFNLLIDIIFSPDKTIEIEKDLIEGEHQIILETPKKKEEVNLYSKEAWADLSSQPMLLINLQKTKDLKDNSKQIFKISMILNMNITVRKQKFIKLCTIIVSHGCHVINNDLIRFCFQVRRFCSIMVVLNEINVMFKYRR